MRGKKKSLLPPQNLRHEEPSSRGEASVDWHIQMNERSIERSGVYLFHIITVNISNFHHEYCSVPWQALIALPTSIGGNDGIRREADSRGEAPWWEGGGREGANYPFITRDRTPHPPPQEASPGPVWDKEDPERHISSLLARIKSHAYTHRPLNAHVWFKSLLFTHRTAAWRGRRVCVSVKQHVTLTTLNIFIQQERKHETIRTNKHAAVKCSRKNNIPHLRSSLFSTPSNVQKNLNLSFLPAALTPETF